MTTRAARGALTILLLLIYSTLSVARVVTNTLRDAGVLRLSVGLAFCAVALTLAVFVARTPALRRPRTLALGALVAAVYAAVIWPMESPEEKLHFIEYGTVAVLAYFAFPHAWPAARRFGAAALFTVAAGWLDEGIQGLLPTRHSDLRDVGFNALAGLLALSAFTLLRVLAARA